MFKIGKVCRVLTLAIALAIASTATNKAHAYCEEYIKDSTEDFEFTKICASSIGKPFYRIVQHLFNEGSSLTFAFAPRSRKLLCHRYELRDETIEYCNNYGVDFFPKKFKGKKFNVTMIDIDQSKPDAFKALFKKKSIFKYPDLAEEIPVDQCFSIIENKKDIYLGFSEKGIIELSQCLIELETFVSENRDIFK